MDFIEAFVFETAKESLQLAIQTNIVDDIIHQGFFGNLVIFHA